MDAIKDGVFACGLAHSPRSIAESIATAKAAAQRALRLLTQKRLPAGRVTARVRHTLCSRCERCIEVCPYQARSLDPDLDQLTVNTALCQGCGACSAACPSGAAVLDGFYSGQMLEMLDAALGR